MKRLVPLFGFCVAVLGCRPQAPPIQNTETATVPITIAAVQPRAIQRTITANGTLSGYDETMLTPKVDGRIRAIFVDAGDVVYPGQTLMLTDPTDYVLAVNDARRALEAELATLDLKTIPEGEFDVENVPLVKRADASVLNARRQYARLNGISGASRSEVDAAETELKVAEATKRDAVTNAKAKLASARWRKAMLDTAEQRLKDCELKVPEPLESTAWCALVGTSAGPLRYTVAQRMASVGDMVRSMPVQNVLKLVITDVLKLRATLPEKYIGELRAGQKVEVKVEAYPDATFPGIVARIHPTVDTSSRTFMVEIQIPNREGKLRIGSFARATIQTRTDTNVPTLPPSAVVRFAGITKIFTIENNIATAVPVEMGMRSTDWVEVIGKIPPDAKVATSGFSQLADGSKVRLRK